MHPVIIKKLNCLFNIQYGFLWVDGWVGGIIVVIVIIIIMCKSVSAAQSVGKEQGRAWPSKQRKKQKQTLETWPRTEPCRSWSWVAPRAPLGLCWPADGGVIEWSPTLPQQLINADSVGLGSQGSIYGGETRPWTLMSNSAVGPVRWPATANVWLFPAVLNGLPLSFQRTGMWMKWVGEGKRLGNPG